MNEKKITRVYSIILDFEIKWKNVILGFYLEQNTKISLFNTIISFFAL